jgi:DNA polymerase-3 subunit gamma/tau
MEMELALIKLCTDQKQEAQDSSALERRIAALEQQAAQWAAGPRRETGNAPAPSAPSQTPNPSPSPPAPSSPLPPDTSLLPPESEDRLFAEWELVLEQLRVDNPPLAGILDGSTAFVRGDFVLIKCGNPALGAFIKQAVHANALRETIFRVTDRKARLGLYRGPQEDAPKDPLAMLAQRQLTIDNEQYKERFI